MAEIKSGSSVTMAVAASAMRAEQARMRVIAENMLSAEAQEGIGAFIGKREPRWNED